MVAIFGKPSCTVAEYWERQNKVLLSLPDSDEPRGSLGPADRPKPHAVDAQTLAADVECGWCSKIGHPESSCRRQNPLCGECGGEHPSRKHLGAIKGEEKMREPTRPQSVQVQVATPQAPGAAGGSGAKTMEPDGNPHRTPRTYGRGWDDNWRGGRGGWRGSDRGIPRW